MTVSSVLAERDYVKRLTMGAPKKSQAGTQDTLGTQDSYWHGTPTTAGELQRSGKAAASFAVRYFRDKNAEPPLTPKGVFVDAAAMKEKMRAQLAKPEYDVRNFYKTSGVAQIIARSPWFDRISLAVIAFNAVWISVDTDYNHSTMLTDAEWPFQVADHLFCLFFFSEWSIRFLAFALKRNGLRDAWFCFDFVMVVMMVMETWVMTIVLYFMGASGGGLGNAGALKLIRLTRLTRMARMARLLRVMPELLVLLKGMWAATRSVFFTLLLLFIIIYVFGIVFTQMCRESAIGEEFFYSVPGSMHTLLLHGTLMDDMTPLVTGLGRSNVVFPVVFYLFLLISSLTVMNMLIGVLCEVVAAVAATEKEESSVAYVKWQIRDIMKKGGLDLDGDGMISKEEFVKILDNPQATRTLSNAGVDVFGLVDCADFIFGEDQNQSDEAADKDMQPVNLSFGDFMEVVLQLRGTNVATVKDLVDLRKFLTVTTKKMDERVARLDRNTANVNAWVVKVSKGMSHHSADAEQSPLIREVMSSETVMQQEICESEALGVPHAHQVDNAAAPAAFTLPTVLSAGSALKSDLFDQINRELDQLRHYVDTELMAIMQDLKVMSQESHESCRYAPPPTAQSNLAVRLPNVDMSVPDLPEESLQSPENLAHREGSSVMCPGAELKCLGADQRRHVTCGL